MHSEKFIKINGDLSKVLVVDWGRFAIMGSGLNQTITPREAFEMLKGQEKRTREKYREFLKRDIEHIKNARKEARVAKKKRRKEE